MSTKVTKLETAETETAPAVTTNSSHAILGVIDRLSANPDIDIDKIERFFDLYERQQRFEAERAFAKAFAAMQPEMPIIAERGEINNRVGQVQSKFAKWEDIVEGIRPVLAKHGFALSFQPTILENGKVRVTAVLQHEDGHKISSTYDLPADTSGSKNAVQALGSSTSYAKRYLASGLLNIASRGEDDGGQAGGGEVVSDEQADMLRSMISATKTDVNKFLTFFKAESVSDLPAAQFERALGFLRKKKEEQEAG